MTTIFSSFVGWNCVRPQRLLFVEFKESIPFLHSPRFHVLQRCGTYCKRIPRHRQQLYLNWGLFFSSLDLRCQFGFFRCPPCGGGNVFVLREKNPLSNRQCNSQKIQYCYRSLEKFGQILDTGFLNTSLTVKKIEHTFPVYVIKAKNRTTFEFLRSFKFLTRFSIVSIQRSIIPNKTSFFTLDIQNL